MLSNFQEPLDDASVYISYIAILNSLLVWCAVVGVLTVERNWDCYIYLYRLHNDSPKHSQLLVKLQLKIQD